MARALLVAALAVAAQAMVGHGPTLKAAIARGQATEVAICAAATGSHECVGMLCNVKDVVIAVVGDIASRELGGTLRWRACIRSSPQRRNR